MFILFRGWAYDDPFITFRYAKNLHQGVGFVYNPGEKVLSTTSPLFALLLGFLSRFFPDIPTLAVFLGSASLIIGGFLLYRLGEAYQTPRVGLVGAFLYPFFPLLVETLGSEMPLILTWGFAAFLSYTKKQYRLTALFSALAVLTRADGLIVPLILSIHFAWSRDKGTPLPLTAIGSFLLVIGAWAVFSYFYFGSLLPATLKVKQHQGAMYGADYLSFFRRLIFMAGRYDSWHYRILFYLMPFGLLFAFLKIRRWLPFIFWPGVFLIGYSYLKVAPYHWYYATLVPGALVLSGLGLEGIIYGSKRLTRSTGPPQWIGRSLSLFVLLLALMQMYDLVQISNRPDKRIKMYTAVGKWLRDNTPPQASVGTLEVGLIGYYSDRRMIDFAGLIQPDVASVIGKGTSYVDSACYAADRYRPDYLVLHKGHIPPLEFKYGNLLCEKVKELAGVDYGYQEDMIILDCRPGKKSGRH